MIVTHAKRALALAWPFRGQVGPPASARHVPRHRGNRAQTWRFASATGLRIAVAVGLTGLLAVPATAAESLKFTTVAWPPYYGPELRDQGFTTVLAKAAFARAGYDYDVEFQNWSRAMATAKALDYDGLHGAFYSPDRQKDFHVSDEPLYTAKTVLITHDRNDLAGYDDLRDLVGYRIGVYQDYAYPEPFASADFLQKIEGRNNQSNLRHLFHGTLDAVAGGQNVIFDIAKRVPAYDPEPLKVVEPPLGEQGLYMMTSRAHPNGESILAAFTRGMAEITADGTRRQILRDFNFPVQGAGPADGDG